MISAADFFDDIVAISFDESRGRSFGSGRLIAKGLVLTAGHVVDYPDRKTAIRTGWRVRLIRERERGGPTWVKGYEGQVVWRAGDGGVGSSELDLALVSLGDVAIEPRLSVQISRNNIIGDVSAVAAGFPRAAIDAGSKSVEYVVSGQLRNVSKTDPLRFSVSPGDAPENRDDWRGISGGPVMCEREDSLHLFGVVREVPANFGAGQLAIASCAEAFTDGKFIGLLENALGRPPALFEWLHDPKIKARTWPPREVIYLVDRRPQSEFLGATLPKPSPPHGILACTVRGGIADMPLELPHSLVEHFSPAIAKAAGLAERDQIHDGGPRLFPIATWPTFCTGNLASDRIRMWEGLRDLFPRCRFDPSRAVTDSDLDHLSSSVSLVGGVRYPIFVDSSGLSAQAQALIAEEFSLWRALVSRRNQIIQRNSDQKFPSFLILMCFIIDQRDVTPAPATPGWRRLLSRRAAERVTPDQSVDAYLASIRQQIQGIPLVALPALSAVTTSDVTPWLQRLVLNKLIADKEAASIGNRFTRRLLSQGARRFSDIVDGFETHEHFIWTGADA